MKKLKSQNGAITMLVLISIMFLISFLISTYVLVMNKAQSQKEIVEETKKIYESPFTMEEIYNSYFNTGNIVPIYTVEQLLYMGTGKQNVNINGKYYNFNNDKNTIYVLMNDLEFNALELGLEEDWIPINDNSDYISNFEWNNYKVKVTTLDEIIVTYDKSGPSTYNKNIIGLPESVTIIPYKNLEQETSKDIKEAALKGKISSVLKENIDGKETIAVVPTGFKVSETVNENTISGGLVIRDGANEFVWIPYTDDSEYIEDNLDPIELLRRY